MRLEKNSISLVSVIIVLAFTTVSESLLCSSHPEAVKQFLNFLKTDLSKKDFIQQVKVWANYTISIESEKVLILNFFLFFCSLEYNFFIVARLENSENGAGYVISLIQIPSEFHELNNSTCIQ